MELIPTLNLSKGVKLTLKIRKNAGEWQQSEEETKIKNESKKGRGKKAGNLHLRELQAERKAEKEDESLCRGWGK